ncbi:MAG: YtxH domain-containing protein [Streptococcus sp.]|nr:YtxH domain-containing protein [Streptococcus sp.]
MGKISSLLLGAISGASVAYFLTTSKGKQVTKKVSDFVKNYHENPEQVHDSVVQSAKEFSDQAVTVIHQTKEKVENGEITTDTIIESVKETTKSVVDYSHDKFQEIKDRLEKEEEHLEEESSEETPETSLESDSISEEIVINLEEETEN